jgi:CheY-like chemotaxis protein
MHLLLIEDNPDLVENLSDFLETRGHAVDIAYNGLSGLRFALEKPKAEGGRTRITKGAEEPSHPKGVGPA